MAWHAAVQSQFIDKESGQLAILYIYIFFNELGRSSTIRLRENELTVQEQKEKRGQAPLPCGLNKSSRCNTQAQSQDNKMAQTGITERARLNCSKHSFVLSAICCAVEWMLSKVR